MNKTFLHPEETGRYKNELLSINSDLLVLWAVQMDSRSSVDTEFDDRWSCDGQMMLKFSPTLQFLLDIDC